MMAARKLERALDRLPPVRGPLSEDAPLRTMTWFRVGGPAALLFRPADVDDLALFLRGKPDDLPVTVIGVGSNLLVRDGGVDGVVIRLGRGFGTIAVEAEALDVGAAALGLKVALTAADAGLKGLEFLSGIPGTIGGALRMNAGAYGAEMKHVVIEATALGGRGDLHRLDLRRLGYTYRHCAVPDDWIFVSAKLRCEPGDPAAIAARIREIRTAREESQPTRARTGGSTFKNPPGTEAWKLVDAAGCRGLRFGGAMVSDKHCNFLINTGDATAADLEALGEEVRRRVHANSGVSLEWEIHRVGGPTATWSARPDGGEP